MSIQKSIATIIILVFFFTACSTTKQGIKKVYRQMSSSEKKLADSLMLTALDNEAMYTLLDTLKPMSSVKMFRLPLLSINETQKDSAINTLNEIQSIVNKMSVGDFLFVLNPFERLDSIYRNVEIYVFRKSRLQNLLTSQSKFYNAWGIASSANPATVLAITEHQNKYDRWRSYGYLFGYPNYAVDFFVEAGKSQDSTKEFVKRDFFHIPVHSSTTGHFTYAIPKGNVPTMEDSMLYKKAIITLGKYKNIRKKYTHNGQTKAFKLFQKLN